MTIALSGFLSQSGASTAVEVCEALPADVRTVHLDLTHLRLYDVAALDSVIDGLNSWESARRGFVSVAAPRQATAP